MAIPEFRFAGMSWHWTERCTWAVYRHPSWTGDHLTIRLQGKV